MRRILSALTLLLCSLAANADNEQGAERVIVYEEGTSIHCGWCIRGLAELEYLAQKFPESVITLSYHDDYSRSESDPMHVAAADPWLKRYCLEMPAMHFNRAEKPGGALFMNMSEIEPYDNQLVERLRGDRSFVRVGVEAAQAVDHRLAADLRLAAEFVLPLPSESDNYQFSVVTTRSGLGPYRQKNYYSGMGYDCSGWENRADNPKVTFNHVVTDMVGFPGIAGSIPSGLKKGDMAVYNLRMELGEEATYTVVCLLVDTRSGEIVNAAKTEFTPSDVNPDNPDNPDVDPNDAIESLTAATDEVIAVTGGIVCAGACRVTGVDGRSSVSSAEGGFIAVAPGFYIVEACGKTIKLLVK